MPLHAEFDLEQAVLEWRGWCGTLWGRFMELALQGSLALPLETLAIHQGINELTRMIGKSLILQMTSDLCSLKEQLLSLLLWWSAMLPCWTWRANCDPRLIDRAHRGVNRQ
ncbi:hypothetical protein JRQ81_017585, partial [Phrynocephalus forsythii]